MTDEDFEIAVEAALRTDEGLHALLDAGGVVVCARKRKGRVENITVYDKTTPFKAGTAVAHPMLAWTKAKVAPGARALLERLVRLDAEQWQDDASLMLHIDPPPSATLRAARKTVVQRLSAELQTTLEESGAPSLQDALEAALSLCEFDPFGPDRLKVAIRTEGGPGTDRMSVVVEHAGRPYGIQASVPLGPVVRNVVVALMTEATETERAQRWLITPPDETASATLRAAKSARSRQICAGHFPALLERQGMAETLALLTERLARR